MTVKKQAGWPKEKFEAWYSQHPVKPHRDYQKTLVPRITALDDRDGFKVEEYGSATYTTLNKKTDGLDKVTHKLYHIIVGDFDPEKPTYIIVGGTHGYEKSGPLAAIGFAEEEAEKYAENCNFIIYPCVCPGPYEKELRFTEGRVDPNRDAFPKGAKSQEMQALAKSLKALHGKMFEGDLTKKFKDAIDLHETPKKDLEIDKENAEAGGELFILDDFPEGLFLIVPDEDQSFGKQIIDFVRNEGHLIVGDDKIYGSPNHDGLLFMSEMGQPTGRVRQLTKLYTEKNLTLEFCGLGISDDMPDAERIAVPRAAIRGMLSL